MRNIKKLMIVGTLSLSGLILSCTSHNGNDQNGSLAKGPDFYLGQTGAIPLDNKNYPVMLYNNTEDNLSITNQDIKLLNSQAINDTAAAKIVDTSLCNTLPAHGECQLNLNLYGNVSLKNGELGVEIHGHKSETVSMKNGIKGSDKGKNDPVGYETSTIISYFTPVSRDLYEYHINDSTTTLHLAKPVNSSIQIPIHFSSEYSSLRFENSGNNMNVKLTGCSHDKVVPGTSCIVSVTVLGGKNFNNHVNMFGLDDKSNSNLILSTPIVNTTNAVGNLLVGAVTQSIVADGSHTLTINVANNGTASITGFTPTVYETPTPLSITNGCGSSISSGSTCTLTLAASSSILSAVQHLQLSYNDGTNAQTIQYPVIIKPNQSSYASLDLSVMGNLVNTPVNYNSSVTITVTNSGTLGISGLSKQFVGGLPSQMSNTTNCGSTLAAGASCNYVINYNPTATVSLASFMTVISGNYTDATGSKTIQNATTISYSAIVQNNYLQYDKTVLLFNGVTNRATTQTITITNSGSNPVSAIAVDFSSVTTQYQGHYSVVANPVGTTLPSCTTGGTVLNNNDKCVVTIQVLSANAYPAIDTGVIIFNYTVNSQAGVDTLAYQSNILNSDVNITAQVTALGAQTGTGIVSNPWNINIINGNDLSLRIDYTNTGSADATNFAVDGVWPTGYSFDAANSTCPAPGTTGTLAHGASCILAITAYSPDIYNAAQFSGSANIAIPDVSYIDNNGNPIDSNNFGNAYVTFNQFNSASIVISSTAYNNTNSTYVNTVTYTVTGSISSTNPVKFTLLSPSGSAISFVSSTGDSGGNSCTLANSTIGATCNIQVQSPIKQVLNVTTRVSSTASALTWINSANSTLSPLTVSILNPTNGATGTSINPTIKLKFSEPVQNVNTSNITLHVGSAGGATVATSAISATSNNQYQLTASANLTPVTQYYVDIANGVTDVNGSAITPINFNFTTYGLTNNMFDIRLSNDYQYIYMVGLNSSTINKCGLDGSGQIIANTCGDSGASGLQPYTIGITFNAAGTVAYVANANPSSPSTTSNIRLCQVGANGALSSCIDSGATGMNYPFPPQFNSSGTKAFISNYNSNIILTCSVNGVNGALSNCVNTGATSLSHPNALQFSQDGTLAYIGNDTSSTPHYVTICSVDSSGIFSNCSNTDIGSIDSSGDLEYDYTNHRLYIISFDYSQINVCDISTVDGSLSNCVNTGATGLNGSGAITVNSQLGLAYISNYYNGGYVTMCTIGASGLLTNCSTY